MALERPGQFFLLALAGVLVLAAAERGVRALLAAREPGRGGCWIWAPGVSEAAEPVAFFAVRDFELAAASRAAIEIAADESYELYVNGRPVGANSFRAGMAVDRYAVGDLLRTGRNRITVALRSARGAGGFLATLVVADAPPADRPLVVTDGDWRIIRRQERELFDPDATLAGGEAPEVWQRSPTGRWRPRPAEVDRPRVLESRGPPPNRFPLRALSFQPGASWKPLRRRQLRLPVQGPEVLLDWGSEVEGLLSFALQISPRNPRPGAPQISPALAFFGLEPPDPEDRPADEIMIFAPGQRAWRDAHARRFRYVLLVGVPALSRVRVWQLDAATAAALAPPASEPAGVFGVRPPERLSAAERRVWERLRSP